MTYPKYGEKKATARHHWTTQTETINSDQAKVLGQASQKEDLKHGKDTVSIDGNWEEEIRVRDEQIRVLKQQLKALGEQPIEEVITLEVRAPSMLELRLRLVVAQPQHNTPVVHVWPNRVRSTCVLWFPALSLSGFLGSGFYLSGRIMLMHRVPKHEICARRRLRCIATAPPTTVAMHFCT